MQLTMKLKIYKKDIGRGEIKENEESNFIK